MGDFDTWRRQYISAVHEWGEAETKESFDEWQENEDRALWKASGSNQEFDEWLRLQKSGPEREPDAMVLWTLSNDGMPFQAWLETQRRAAKRDPLPPVDTTPKLKILGRWVPMHVLVGRGYHYDNRLERLLPERLWMVIGEYVGVERFFEEHVPVEDRRNWNWFRRCEDSNPFMSVLNRLQHRLDKIRRIRAGLVKPCRGSKYCANKAKLYSELCHPCHTRLVRSLSTGMGTGTAVK